MLAALSKHASHDWVAGGKRPRLPPGHWTLIVNDKHALKSGKHIADAFVLATHCHWGRMKTSDSLLCSVTLNVTLKGTKTTPFRKASRVVPPLGDCYVKKTAALSKHASHNVLASSCQD